MTDVPCSTTGINQDQDSCSISRLWKPASTIQPYNRPSICTILSLQRFISVDISITCKVLRGDEGVASGCCAVKKWRGEGSTTCTTWCNILPAPLGSFHKIIAIIDSKPAGIIFQFNHDLGSPIWPSKLLSTENCSFLQNSTLGKFCVLVYVRPTLKRIVSHVSFKMCGSSGIHGAAADTVTSWNWVESCVYVRPNWKTGVKWSIYSPHSNTPIRPIKSFRGIWRLLAWQAHRRSTHHNMMPPKWVQFGFCLEPLDLYLSTRYTHGWPSKLNLSHHDIYGYNGSMQKSLY